MIAFSTECDLTKSETISGERLGAEGSDETVLKVKDIYNRNVMY